MGLMSFLRVYKTFSHGVHVVEHKELTAGLPIKRLAFAENMMVLLSQHRGAPALPIVKTGQEVLRGEPVAKAGGYVSVPMHSPVTGVVKSVNTLVATAEGPKQPAIIIETYPAATQEVLYQSPQDPETMTREALIEAVQASGMVGLGGAAFPSHVKLLPPDGKEIHTLIVNGCECEPYLTCDHRVMLEQTETLIRGINIILKATGAERAIIGVENNKLDAERLIRNKLPKGGKIRVEAVEAKYPQGAEKMLIASLLGQEVPSGGIPADIGLAVYNVGTLTQLGSLIPAGRGLIERVVTVSGSGVTKPGNYLVPIGTPLRFLLKQVGSTSDANKVITGGPMMGMSVSSLDVAITKGVSGVVVLEHTAPESREHTIYPCIRCGECLEACPIHLNPSMLGLLATVRNYERMQQQYHLNDCFECGCCSYVCPSNIPLTQYFRIAKAVNRETMSAA